MATVNVYLTFNGNCSEAFDFYKNAFRKEFSDINYFGEMPPNPAQNLSEDDQKRIMHVKLQISAETFLYGSDLLSTQNNFKPGNNFSISLDVKSREEAEQLFSNLSENGKITMALEDTFWGAYFGMWTDQFGINWMVNYDKPAKIQDH